MPGDKEAGGQRIKRRKGLNTVERKILSEEGWQRNQRKKLNLQGGKQG